MKTSIWKCSLLFMTMALALCGCEKKQKDQTDDVVKEANRIEGAYDEDLETIISECFTYEIEDETAIVSGVYQYMETGVVPDILDYEGKEYPVVKIKKEALQDNSVLRTVILPDTLREIEDAAFYGCDNIEEVRIPDSVEKMGNGVFFNCNRLQKVVFGKGLDGIPDETFSNCYELSEVEFPDHLLYIGVESFWGCENLKTFTIPSDVVTVGSRAFYGSGIETMEIQSASINLVDDMFDGMSELQTLTVPPERVEGCEELARLSTVTVNPLDDK